MQFLIEALKTELIAQKHNASGAAVNSLKMTREGKDWVCRGAGYLYWVQYGRKPGKLPPIHAIRNWLQTIGKDVKAAFPIARAIAEKGIPSKPYASWAEGNSLQRTEFITRVIEQEKDNIAEYLLTEGEITIFEKYKNEVIKINELNTVNA